MKLVEVIPDAGSRSVYMSWCDAPLKTASYRIFSIRRGAPADQTAGTEETASLIGTTANTFFSDIRYYDSSILRRETFYIIKAVAPDGTVLDQLTVRPMESESELIQKVINAANYKAHLFFRNYNWSQVVYILRYRQTGQKCACYSRDFEKSRDPDCAVCYGGGFAGGFYAAIPTKILPINSETSDQSIDDPVPSGLEQRVLTLPRFPAVFKGDLLVSDRIGLMSVVSSSYNSVATTPTPTIMVTAVGLGKDHPAHKYNFHAVIPSITGLEAGDGTLTLKGANLVPVVGSVSVVIEEGPEGLDGINLSATEVKSVTPSAIVFRAPSVKEQAAVPFIRYRVFLNNVLYVKTQP